MSLRKIAIIGHPVLRKPTRELSREELASSAVQQLIDDMIETMRDANGAGIAVNQVYESLRITTIEVRPNNPRYPYKPAIPLTVLVNPRVEPLAPDTETFDNYEGCLSVPDLRGLVPRFVEARLRAWDREGREIDQIVRGL